MTTIPGTVTRVTDSHFAGSGGDRLHPGRWNPAAVEDKIPVFGVDGPDTYVVAELRVATKTVRQ